MGGEPQTGPKLRRPYPRAQHAASRAVGWLLGFQGRCFSAREKGSKVREGLERKLCQLVPSLAHMAQVLQLQLLHCVPQAKGSHMLSLSSCTCTAWSHGCMAACRFLSRHARHPSCTSNSLPTPPLPLAGLTSRMLPQVASRLGVPAGPLLDSRWTALASQLGYDIVTYKTIRTNCSTGHGLPNVLFLEPTGQLPSGRDPKPLLVSGCMLVWAFACMHACVPAHACMHACTCMRARLHM